MATATSIQDASQLAQTDDPLLDLLLPLLPVEDQNQIFSSASSKLAAKDSVAKIRSLNLNSITDTTLQDQLQAEEEKISDKISNLTLKSYPQLLQSAIAVDDLLEQFDTFKTQANEFYESQFTYIDSELHHYLKLSNTEDGEKLGITTALDQQDVQQQKQYSNSSGNTPSQHISRYRRSSSINILRRSSINNKVEAHIYNDNGRRISNSHINTKQLLHSEQNAHQQEKTVEDAVTLLKNLDRIQDILELPSLTWACVNNGYYAEALDLASHTNRLSKRYSHVKVIQDLQQQVDEALKTMVVQLLRLLKESVKLPTLIKVISYLRRVAPFNTINSSNMMNLSDFSNPTPVSPTFDVATRQLQQLFLFSRLQYINDLLNSLEPLKKQSPEAYLKRYIESFREHVFVTVVGFRSVFSESSVDEESIRNNTSLTDNKLFSGTRNTEFSENLIASFIRTLYTKFYDTVCQIAPFIDDPSYRNSLFLQISYCSKSLGRVGADFWPSVQGPEDDDSEENKESSLSNQEEELKAMSKKEWISAVQKQLDINKHYISK